MTSRVLTQNVKAHPPMPQFRVLEDVFLSSKQADLIGWQEIEFSRYRNAILSIQNKEWGHFLDTSSPISWRFSEWKYVNSGKELLYWGIPKFSPTRYLTWVLLEHTRTGALVYVVNCHFVAGAFREGNNRLAFRKMLWKRCRRILREFLVKAVDEDIMVIGLGDYNNKTFLPVEPIIEGHVQDRRVQFVTPEDSYDHVFFINNSKFRFVELAYQYLRKRNSDHQGRQGSFKIEEKVKK